MISYRPEIDGLRALAVIPVILFHLGFNWIGGGYFGVDIFFVISGYLITSIIFKELSLGVFKFSNFWIRRIKRILPLLFTVIIVVLFVAFFIAFKPNLRTYSQDAIAATFSYSNISLLMKFSDYWSSTAEDSPFLHTWSLAVEEQFYLIYPFVLFFLFKKGVSIYKSLIIIIILSFGLFYYGSINHPNATFFLLPTRAWELALGGLIGVVKIDRASKRSFEYFLPIVGLIFISTSFFILTGNDSIGLYAVLPVLGSALIIYFSNQSEIVGRFLSMKPIVFIGKLSYSLYLWHWPIIVFSDFYLQGAEHNTTSIFLILILTSLLSVISYFFIENTTRKWRHTIKLNIFLILIIIITYSIFNSGYINLKYQNNFDTVKFYALYYDITPNVKVDKGHNKLKRDGIIAPRRDSINSRSYAKSGIFKGENIEGYPEIVIIGDSHGAMWAKIIDEIGAELNFKRSFYTSVGNNPFFNVLDIDKQKKTKGFNKEQRKEYAKSLIRNLKKWKPKTIVISCKWSSLNDEDVRNFENLLDLISLIKSNVILINQPPIINAIGENNSSQYVSYLGYLPNGKEQFINIKETSKVISANIFLNNLSQKFDNIKVVDVHSRFIKDDKAMIIKNNTILYYDDDHLSHQGTELFKSKLKELINIKNNKSDY